MWWKSLASLARARHRSDYAVPQAQEVSRRNGGDELAVPIHITGVGIEPPDYDLLVDLAADLARTFGASCHIEEEWMDARFAYDIKRNQYYATALLESLCSSQPSERVLGVASVDLFVPVLTFVFGEAQLEGNCAVVSYYRLTEPGRPELLRERLTKEAVHELGHTYGLRHCHDWECVMSSSHSVERLDVKSSRFCPRCLRDERPGAVRAQLR